MNAIQQERKNSDGDKIYKARITKSQH